MFAAVSSAALLCYQIGVDLSTAFFLPFSASFRTFKRLLACPSHARRFRRETHLNTVCASVSSCFFLPFSCPRSCGRKNILTRSLHYVKLLLSSSSLPVSLGRKNILTRP